MWGGLDSSANFLNFREFRLFLFICCYFCGIPVASDQADRAFFRLLLFKWPNPLQNSQKLRWPQNKNVMKSLHDACKSATQLTFCCVSRSDGRAQLKIS
jgi:hypothetical protein